MKTDTKAELVAIQKVMTRLNKLENCLKEIAFLTKKINIELSIAEAEKELANHFNNNGAYEGNYTVKINPERQNTSINNYSITLDNKIALIKFLRQTLLWIDERQIPHSHSNQNTLSLGDSKRLVEEYIEKHTTK